MQTQHVVILGAGYAGQIAAGRLAQKGPAVRITVVDASPVFVERVRLHQVMARQSVKRRPMPSLLPTKATFTHGRVTGWDVQNRRLEVAAEAGATTLSYDRLIYALGSAVDTKSVPGVAEHAHVLNGLAQSDRLADALAALPAGSRVVVVGGGLTGIEAVTELAESRPDLMVELAAADDPGAALAPEGAAHLARAFARLRVRVITGARVRRLDARAAQLADGRTLPFDVCIWAAGFVAPPLAAEAGLPVNARGQLVVDETLRVTGRPEILGAGDAACVTGAGVPVRMACATAMPMGVFAAEQIGRALRGSGPRRFPFAYVIRCISLGRRDGLVQRVGPDDRPLPKVYTGRKAALIKETICRSTVFSLRAERLGIAFYWWPQPPAREVGSAPLADYARAE